MVNNNVAYPNIMLALFFFVLIVSEFFINYQISCEKFEAWYKSFANRQIEKFKNRFPNFSKKIMKKSVALTPHDINPKPKLEAPTNINSLNDEKEGK